MVWNEARKIRILSTCTPSPTPAPVGSFETNCIMAASEDSTSFPGSLSSGRREPWGQGWWGLWTYSLSLPRNVPSGQGATALQKFHDENYCFMVSKQRFSYCRRERHSFWSRSCLEVLSKTLHNSFTPVPLELSSDWTKSHDTEQQTGKGHRKTSWKTFWSFRLLAEKCCRRYLWNYFQRRHRHNEPRHGRAS